MGAMLEMMQQMIDASQKHVNGKVRLKLYKGSVSVVGRKSDDSLFDEKIATMEDDAGSYNQEPAAGCPMPAPTGNWQSNAGSYNQEPATGRPMPVPTGN